MFELLFENVPRSMPLIYEYVGNELLEVYFKVALEVDNATGDKDTALKFLRLC